MDIITKERNYYSIKSTEAKQLDWQFSVTYIAGPHEFLLLLFSIEYEFEIIKKQNTWMMSKKKETKEELFCLCRKAFDEGDEDQMMIECDSCKDWLHGK